MNNIIKVLIIEDNIDDAELLVLELESANYQVYYQRIETSEAMISAIKNEKWDLILSDYSLPNFSAISAINIYKKFSIDIPFIVVSGSIKEEIVVDLMKNGVHDYLVKNQLTRLIPAIERELREAKIRNEHQEALEKIKILAFEDELTGLPNRHALLKTLEISINQYKKFGQKFAIILLDIDQYRTIKYGFGHLKSEQLLIEIAKRLQDNLTENEYLAKVGKDEFIIILKNIHDLDKIEAKAINIHEILNPPLQLDGFLIYASATIGIVDCNSEFDEPEDYLRTVEIANYNAKESGSVSNSTVRYNTKMQSEIWHRLQIETELRYAISHNQLELFYQPIVDLNNDQLAGFEALIRWKHPQHGWITPDVFIKLAEQTGLIIPLGDWILEAAFNQMKIWETQLQDYLPLTLSVNLSTVQLNEITLVPTVMKLYQRLDKKRMKLKLEITESKLMNNTQIIIDRLQEMRSAGIQVSIDDFGTGYSSLAYLQDIPLDTLKIDRSFVAKIGKEQQTLGILKAIIDLSHTLGFDVVAEGIETLVQIKNLRSLGCQYGQGYLFSPPIPADSVKEWIKFYTNKFSRVTV